MASHPNLLALLLERQPLAVRARGRPRGDAELLQRVLQVVPHSLRLHCVGASLAERTLRLVVTSPAWATRARYSEADILDGLRDREVERLIVTVRPGGQGGGRPRVHPQAVDRRLSQRTVAHLLAMSEVIEDPDLACALRNLARRHVVAAGNQ
jgi:hypothetical protein